MKFTILSHAGMELAYYFSAALHALWHRGSASPVREFVPRVSA